MRVVFCGSGSFAVPSLAAVAQSSAHQVVGVVSQPPRPSGRGGKLHHTPVAEHCSQMGLPLVELENINTPQSLDVLRALGGDVMCVADFGQFVRKPARDLYPAGTFNLHGSVLPELRGAAPLNWAIIRGCKTTGLTTFSLVDKMDAGPIYLTCETPIFPHETVDDLRERLAQMGAKLVCETLDALAAGRMEGRVQDESKASLAPRLTKADGTIDWSVDAQTVRNRIHGTWSWPGASAVFHGQRHRDLRVVFKRVEADATPGTAPGKLDQDLCVGAGTGRLRVLELQPAGKRLMAWKDFANGYRLAAGDVFL